MDVLDLINDSNQVGPGHDFLVRPYVCNYESCDRAFARKSDLARHFRIHTNERPFICVYHGCGKAFIQRSALTVHTRVHTGERPHHCETCNKAFADSSSLARHRRIHTGKRPYGCNVPGCGRSFARRNTYLKHFKRQHPDLPPPTSSSVRALHVPAYRSATISQPSQQAILTPGPMGPNGQPQYYVSTAVTSPVQSHPHSFAAPNPPEGAAHPISGGYITSGQLANSSVHGQLVVPSPASGGHRQYLSSPQALSERQVSSHPSSPLSAHAGISSTTGPETPATGRTTGSELQQQQSGPAGVDDIIHIVNPDYSNHQSVFAYPDNALSRVPSANGGMIYFKSDQTPSSVIRSFNDPARLAQAQWGGVGGGFALSQLALPPLQPLPLQPSYYQHLAPMHKGDKLDGHRVPHSPMSDRGMSPEALVEISYAPTVKFAGAQYMMPYSVIGPIHSAPPHLQRFHSSPAIPAFTNGWSEIEPYKVSSVYGEAHSIGGGRSGEDENWEELEEQMLSREASDGSICMEY